MATKNYHTTNLVAAWQNIIHGGATLPRQGRPFFLCSACLERFPQCETALYANLIHLYPWRGTAVLVLCFFRADTDMLQRIAFVAQYAVQARMLVLASGGDVGACIADAEHRRGAGSSIADAEHRGGSGAQLPVMWYWHSSVARNTVHQVALASVPPDMNRSEVLFANFDCDNLLCGAYLQKTQLIYQVNEHVPFLIVRCLDCDVGCAARMVYRACDFFALGGFDEQSWPCGYQEVDLKNRFAAAQMGGGIAGEPIIGVIRGPGDVGGALPNDASSVRLDRNVAKIRNVDPDVLQRFQDFGEMYAANAALLNTRTGAGQLRRNICLASGPGAFWHIVRAAYEVCSPSSQVSGSSPQMFATCGQLRGFHGCRAPWLQCGHGCRAPDARGWFLSCDTRNDTC